MDPLLLFDMDIYCAWSAWFELVRVHVLAAGEGAQGTVDRQGSTATKVLTATRYKSFTRTCALSPVLWHAPACEV